MTQNRVAAAAIACLGLAVVGGYLASSDAVPNGQLVFSPSSGDDDLSRFVDLGRGGIEVEECVDTDDGLRAKGHVSTPGNGRPVVIYVSGGDPKESGRNVSAGFAANARMFAEADAEGDFLIMLPWASLSSAFSVVSAVAPGSGARMGVVGESAVCPAPGVAGESGPQSPDRPQAR